MNLLELLIPTALAAEEQGAGFTSFIPIILLIVVFYFLLIRPQQKRAKEHKNLLSNLNVGDNVLTNGGVIGKITKLDDEDDNYLLLEIADNTIIKVQKQAINQKMPKDTYSSKK